jgi:hypothetical protein
MFSGPETNKNYYGTQYGLQVITSYTCTYIFYNSMTDCLYMPRLYDEKSLQALLSQFQRYSIKYLFKLAEGQTPTPTPRSSKRHKSKHKKVSGKVKAVPRASSPPLLPSQRRERGKNAADKDKHADADSNSASPTDKAMDEGEDASPQPQKKRQRQRSATEANKDNVKPPAKIPRLPSLKSVSAKPAAKAFKIPTGTRTFKIPDKVVKP